MAARMGYSGRDETRSTHDLVEQMQFLYVNVVKAKDLPMMDNTGSFDPYVEVKIGEYKGVTKHLEKNQYPVWNSVFAFQKENLQSNLIEVIVNDEDDFLGKVVFDVMDVPLCVRPDSPLTPQWYKLEKDKEGLKTAMPGEIMLAVWMGTQADEAFAEACHSDAHSVSPQTLASTRSKVYFSPKFYYLRIHVIEGCDILPAEEGRAPILSVRIQVGQQEIATWPAHPGTINPVWNEEHMFVIAEPFDEYIIIGIDDEGELMGVLSIPVREVPQRGELPNLPDGRWFNLHKPSVAEEESEKKKEIKFSSKIRLRICVEAGYHVLEESPYFCSDIQPSANHLRKPKIGILELGILSARNLLPWKEGRTADAYCVAKYGNKWVRTRTLVDTLTPRWNEQFAWEVYDLNTVITIGVFGNCHINGSKDDERDQRIGKLRILLSTLETDRIYKHYYPLLVLRPSGLKKHGELHLALRFTCTSWVNMITQYGRPAFPKLHYVQPIPVRHYDMQRHRSFVNLGERLSRVEPPVRREAVEYLLDVFWPMFGYSDWLRHQALLIVVARLSRAEPPLRKEAVEYMLDPDFDMFNLRRSKNNLSRIESLLSGILTIYQWFNDICHWKNPLMTILVHVLFFVQVRYFALILPNIFLCLFVIGLWNYQFKPLRPSTMSTKVSLVKNSDPDELDEEFDTFPTSRPIEIVRMRYDRLRSVAGWFSSIMGDVALQGERVLSIVSWEDPRATFVCIILALLCSVVLYFVPVQVAQLIGLYVMRHPLFRSKLPSLAEILFSRLPSKSDILQ